MKRTLAFGGIVATAGLLASALAIPAQAAPGGGAPAGETVAAKDAWVETAFWFYNNGRALLDAQEYHPDYKLNKHTARLNSKGAPASDGKTGIIPAIGEEKKVAVRSKNINLPKTVGKVFWTEPGADTADVDRDGNKTEIVPVSYWCSATSVQSGHRNLVATAGHCAYNTDGDDHVLDHWVFIPGYYQGKTPFGAYAAKAAYVHYDFDVYEDYDRDYAFVSVYNGLKLRGIEKVTDHTIYDQYVGPKDTVFELNADGSIKKDEKGLPIVKFYALYVLEDVGRLGDNVGGQGFAYNVKPGKYVYAFGYPAGEHRDGDKPYTGITQKWVYGKTSKIIVDSALKIEEQIGLKASVTPGFDGAPWLLKYSNTKRTGYVNGVTSTFIDSDDNGRYDYIGSPFFDGETYGVYKAAANVWSGSILPPEYLTWIKTHKN